MSLLTDTPRAGSHTDSAAAFVPDQSRAERARSYRPEDFEVPTGREEDWRFTPLDRLRGLTSDATFEGGSLSVSGRGSDQVTVQTVGRDHEAVGSSGYVPGSRASALAWAAADEVRLITVPREAELAEPFVLETTGASSEGASAGHTVVVAGRHSRATVVLAYSGSATTSENVEIVVEDGAELTLVTVGEWRDDSVQLASHHGLVGRDASLKHIVVTLGGDVVRHDTSIAYAGPGGSFDGLGVYFADAGQHLEHRLFVDHEAPHCRSNVEYKGALQGETARTVWIGDVLIQAAAEGTDTYELNRNLVLTDGARADSVPNLEIETGEIAGAGHASTTGRFDDEQLFYLQSRGIPQDEARRLVVRGFFASIVQRIGVPEVTERVMSAIEAELAAAEQ